MSAYVHTYIDTYRNINVYKVYLYESLISFHFINLSCIYIYIYIYIYIAAYMSCIYIYIYIYIYVYIYVCVCVCVCGVLESDSSRERLLCVRPYFSNSAEHVLSVIRGWFIRWEANSRTAFGGWRGRNGFGRPTRTFIYQLCAETGTAMDNGRLGRMARENQWTLC